MSRLNTALILAFGLAVGAFFISGTSQDDAEAGPRSAKNNHLFAPAANYALHDDYVARQEELRCLALNIYWEARSEPIPGQLAVAAVTLNRVQSDRFPSNVCDVVRQGGENRHRCQFSWWCDGKNDEPKNARAWRQAMVLARLVSAGVIKDPTHGSLWYHADYVTPYWAGAKEQVTRIGRHIFYILPESKTLQVSENVDTEVATR
ncbi:MAG: cell wall hydrolase [Rhodospirillales bacterium]